MRFNTYPNNPFPPSTDRMDADALEAEVNQLKSGLTNLDVAVNAPDNAGKNLLPFTLASLKALNASGTWADNVYTKNGVEFTVNTNASGQVVSIVADGTATGGNADFDLTSNASIAEASKGLLYSGCPSGSATTYGLCRSGANIIQYGGNDVAWPTTVSAVSTYIRVINEATCDNVTFTPMLRDARISDATFAPYIPSVESRIEAVESGLIPATKTYTLAQGFSLASWGSVRIYTVGKLAIISVSGLKSETAITSETVAITIDNISFITSFRSTISPSGIASVGNNVIAVDAVSANENLFFEVVGIVN